MNHEMVECRFREMKHIKSKLALRGLTLSNVDRIYTLQHDSHREALVCVHIANEKAIQLFSSSTHSGF